MPWTFAHPAAVLPLRRLCPCYLNFPALVIGSLTPDFGYHLFWLDLSRFAHSFPGGLFGCVLPGLLLLAGFYLLRKPVCYLLPQPHRSALLPLAEAPDKLTLTTLLSIVVSLAIGAATHIAWDSLTHKGGWVVARVLYLQEPVFRLAGTGILAYQFLQHLGTLLGIVMLGWAYSRWLRRDRQCARPYVILREDRWRYIVLGVLAVAALIWAFATAIDFASRFDRFRFDVFVFRVAVDSMTVFIALLAAAAFATGRG